LPVHPSLKVDHDEVEMNESPAEMIVRKERPGREAGQGMEKLFLAGSQDDYSVIYIPSIIFRFGWFLFRGSCRPVGGGGGGASRWVI
jgi:hypothetical protein